MSDIISTEELTELATLYKAASTGNWFIQRDSYGASLYITTALRETTLTNSPSTGAICTIHKQRISIDSKDSDGYKSVVIPIKTAENDAELIIKAVNFIPRFIKALSTDGKSDSVAWVIQYPADDYGPIRYYAAGHRLPVIDINKATRFSREQDAKAIIEANEMYRVKAVEHLWKAPVIEEETLEDSASL